MKVKDLKKILQECDDEYDIWFSREGEWVGLMKEDISDDYEAYDDCPEGLYIGI